MTEPPVFIDFIELGDRHVSLELFARSVAFVKPYPKDPLRKTDVRLHDREGKLGDWIRLNLPCPDVMAALAAVSGGEAGMSTS